MCWGLHVLGLSSYITSNKIHIATSSAYGFFTGKLVSYSPIQSILLFMNFMNTCVKKLRTLLSLQTKFDVIQYCKSTAY